MYLRCVLVGQLWKRACSTVSGPPSVVVETPVARSRRMIDVIAASKLEWKETEKRMMFLDLLHHDGTGLTVEETLNKFMSDDEKKKRRFPFVVTKTDLYSWAKLLHKDCKHQRAREIFEWMESKNMSLSGYKLAFYIELIAKTKGFDAAYNHFRKIDPYVNDLDTKSKNMPAFSLLSRLRAESFEKSRFGLKLLSHSHLNPDAC